MGYHDLAIRKKMIDGINVDAWSGGLGEEIDFWEKLFPTFSRQDFLDNENELFPKSVLADNIDDSLGDEVALLDVGSGPFSRVPRNINGRNINITPVDPLAKKYNKIIDKSDVDYPFLKIIEGTGESLAEQFSENSFDIVFSYNALDHSMNPLKCINNMIKLCKKSGSVIFTVVEKEASFWNFSGLHQWDFYMSAEELILEDKDKNRYIVKDYLFGDFEINYIIREDYVYTEKRNFITVIIKKN